MKKILISSVLLAGLSVAHADSNLKMGGYFRSGFGQSNGKKRICIGNGTSGNEFRLGNECGTYMETNFNYGIGGTKYEDAAARAHITFALTDTNNNTQYEAATVQLVEGWADMGKGDDMKWWAGKRFYRWGDIHMNDFYYFGAMSGTGAGMESMKTSAGTLALALLQETSTSNNSTAKTTDGYVGKTVLDARLGGFKVADAHNMDFWLAAGSVSGGTPQAGGTDYKSYSGTAAGVRLNSDLGEGNSNTFAITYGQGALSSQSMSFDVVQGTPDTKSGKSTKNLVDSIYWKGSNWDVTGALIYSETTTGPDSASTTKWTSIGVRPTYYLTDMYSVTAQLGRSAVKVDSGTENYLNRYTVAFQIQPSVGLYSRPSLRLYYTSNAWNSENSTITGSDNILTNKTNYSAIGTQVEVWF